MSRLGKLLCFLHTDVAVLAFKLRCSLLDLVLLLIVCMYYSIVCVCVRVCGNGYFCSCLLACSGN